MNHPKTAYIVATTYPKIHLFTACSLFFLLAVAFFVFPSKEVSAKREQSRTESPQPDLNQGKSSKRRVRSRALSASNHFEAKQSVTPSAPAAKSNEPTKHIITVTKGDTLSTLFTKVGLGINTLNQALASSREAKRFSRLNIGQELEFTLDEQGELLRLSSELSPLETLQLDKTENGFAFARKLTKPSIEEHYIQGTIEKSLLEDAKASGLSYALALNMASIFNYDIDFARDIQPGDEFEVIYQRKLVNGEDAGTGHILSARFINRGKAYTAIRYVNAQGFADYYRADGSSTRRAFIRTPVDFTRISSRFSLGRRHPVLNRIRAHKGVDYAASQGTPIKATGNGRVLFAGDRRNGYGNYVLIQHGKHYQTLYGHMRSFAKGMRSGATVQQGQIIGYVGMTGLATGPHLHYEFRVNGVHVDPLSHKLPTADPISGKEKQRFLQHSQPLLARMDSEKASVLAMRKP